MEPVFLSLDEVLEIHEQQIERYAGSAGLRDGAGLESAVATPQATFGGEFLHTSIPAMAAAYLFHLCQNHAFIDGNKRVGANAAITFLLMNNWEPAFAETELVDMVLSVASGVNQLLRNNAVNLFAVLSGLFGGFSESEPHQNQSRRGYDK
jgi:death on curing protein